MSTNKVCVILSYHIFLVFLICISEYKEYELLFSNSNKIRGLFIFCSVIWRTIIETIFVFAIGARVWYNLLGELKDNKYITSDDIKISVNVIVFLLFMSIISIILSFFSTNYIDEKLPEYIIICCRGVWLISEVLMLNFVNKYYDEQVEREKMFVVFINNVSELAVIL